MTGVLPVATLLTLFIIPPVYLTFERFFARLREWLDVRQGRKKPAISGGTP